MAEDKTNDKGEDVASMRQLVAELAKQRSVLKDDLSSLILESLKPLQSAVNAIRDTVNSFQERLASTETLAGENFERLNTAETVIKDLKAANQELLDRVDDLENRSRRSIWLNSWKSYLWKVWSRLFFLSHPNWRELIDQ